MCPGYLLGHNVQEKAHVQVINYSIMPNKGNNKITELRAILQRESQNS